MNWAQTITLVVTIVVAVLSGIIYSNRGIDDLRENTNARFASLQNEMNARFAEMNARFGEMHAELLEIRSMLHELMRARA